MITCNWTLNSPTYTTALQVVSFKLAKFQLLPGARKGFGRLSNTSKYQLVTTRHTRTSSICSCGTFNFCDKNHPVNLIWEKLPKTLVCWFLNDPQSSLYGCYHPWAGTGKLMTIPYSKSLLFLRIHPNSDQNRWTRVITHHVHRLNLPPYRTKNHYEIFFFTRPELLWCSPCFWICLVFFFKNLLRETPIGRRIPSSPNSTTCF